MLVSEFELLMALPTWNNQFRATQSLQSGAFSPKTNEQMQELKQTPTQKKSSHTTCTQIIHEHSAEKKHITPDNTMLLHHQSGIWIPHHLNLQILRSSLVCFPNQHPPIPLKSEIPNFDAHSRWHKRYSPALHHHSPVPFHRKMVGMEDTKIPSITDWFLMIGRDVYQQYIYIDQALGIHLPPTYIGLVRLHVSHAS